LEVAEPIDLAGLSDGPIGRAAAPASAVPSTFPH
jgi:hypothetical protein